MIKRLAGFSLPHLNLPSSPATIRAAKQREEHRRVNTLRAPCCPWLPRFEGAGSDPPPGLQTGAAPGATRKLTFVPADRLP